MVVDAARVLSAESVQRINQLIFEVKSKSGGELVMVTLPDLGGRDVADVALRIGREWRVGAASAIGESTRNAGIVVLIVPKETSADGRGHISIQTGQGTEGFITDATAGSIRHEAIPFFQRQDYSSAAELIAVRVGQQFAREFNFALGSDSGLSAVNVSRRSVNIPPQVLAVFGLIVVFIIWSVLTTVRRRGLRGCLMALAVEAATSRRRRSSWGGGGGFGGGSFGGGGGFGGFGGGGGFSGGGSSGSW